MSFENTDTTIGIRIPNVPHDVPVANAITHPIRNTTAGSKLTRLPASPPTNSSTNSLLPRLSVIAFSVHASVRIMLAGIIALNPSGKQSMISLNEISLLPRNQATHTRIARSDPVERPTDASVLENDSTNPVPLKNPPA